LFTALVTKVTRVYMCTVTFRFLYPISAIDPHSKKIHYEFLLMSFGATPSEVFARKLWSALLSAPQPCRQKYTKLGIVRNIRPRRLAEIHLRSAMNCCLPPAGIFRIHIKIKCTKQIWGHCSVLSQYSVRSWSCNMRIYMQSRLL
jgi:hypothetical protein